MKDEELKQCLVETIDQMPMANAHTLAFMVVHLKHLVACRYQNEVILIDTFCPILLGDIEVKRKMRLFKTLMRLDNNVLISFAES